MFDLFSFLHFNDYKLDEGIDETYDNAEGYEESSEFADIKYMDNMEETYDDSTDIDDIDDFDHNRAESIDEQNINEEHNDSINHQDEELDDNEQLSYRDTFADEFAHMNIHEVQEVDTFEAVLIGNPDMEIEHWHYQTFDDSCAVVAQKGVLESITGLEIPEEELVKLAYDNDWYNPGHGTAPEAVGNILEAYGIPVIKEYDASIEDIYNAIEGGQKVIVGLDGNEIWNPQIGLDGNPIEQINAGHAVWVTGLKQHDDGSWSVVLNDSGICNGAGEEVALEDFFNAWDDFGRFTVTTTY